MSFAHLPRNPAYTPLQGDESLCDILLLAISGTFLALGLGLDHGRACYYFQSAARDGSHVSALCVVAPRTLLQETFYEACSEGEAHRRIGRLVSRVRSPF